MIINVKMNPKVYVFVLLVVLYLYFKYRFSYFKNHLQFFN